MSPKLLRFHIRSKQRDLPEAGDGAPPVPEQAPAGQASIVGGDVSPHAGIPVFHIHHNHLRSSPGHGRALWPRDLGGPHCRAGALRRTRTAALVMAGGCGHDNFVARVVVLAPCAGSMPTCRAGPAGSSGYGPIREHWPPKDYGCPRLCWAPGRPLMTHSRLKNLVNATSQGFHPLYVCSAPQSPVQAQASHKNRWSHAHAQHPTSHTADHGPSTPAHRGHAQAAHDVHGDVVQVPPIHQELALLVHRGN